MFIESQSKFNCIINTDNISGIYDTTSNYGYGLGADDNFKLCEYKSNTKRNEIYSEILKMIKNNTVRYYRLPEDNE